ncbi:insulin-like [Oryzias latipes]|uniref:Insulin n=2 Tax=Oryzias latipes TaxID=8090 RepID=A0A3P9HA55_ORYLA
MATLWIHTASLLILLVMSFPTTQATTLQHLCGSHLVEALYIVCGDNGFFYNPQSAAGSPVQSRALSAGGETEGAPFKEQMKAIAKRNILERCCYMPCTIYDLASFCS